MPDFKPTILRRMLTLRQFPLFAKAELDELATMAENLKPAHFPAGALIAPASSFVPTVQLIVHGQIDSKSGQSWHAREVFGALEVAAGRALASPAIAATETDTLELPAADFADVLEDNFGVMQSALRELATRLLASAPPPARPVPVAVGEGPIGLVERLILLRQQLPFTSARLQPLAMLAQASEELRYATGDVVAAAGDPATAGLVLIEGTLRAYREDGLAHALVRGQHFGFVETLAGANHSYTLEATSSLRVLASPGRAILDVLEDHTDVGLTMLAAFASALLDTHLN
jgi:CRP-like cAMP-binding protein